MNSNSKHSALNTDFLLDLSMRSSRVFANYNSKFNYFYKQLSKLDGVFALIEGPHENTFYSNIDLNAKLQKTIFDFIAQKNKHNSKAISKRTKLYQGISKKIKSKNFELHLIENPKGIKALLACDVNLSKDKNFNTLLKIIKSSIKQIDLIISNNDITSSNTLLKKENAELKQSILKQNKEINENIEVPKRIVDLNSFPIVNVRRGKILSYNPALKTLLECSDNYLKTCNYIDIIHPDFRERIMQMAMQFILGKATAETVQVKVITAKKKVKDIIMSMHSIPDDDGIHQYTNCTIYDITQKKKLEDQLISSQSQYELLVEASPAGIIHTDENGIIQFISAKGTEIFACDKKRLVGKKLHTLISKSNQADFLKAVHTLNAENKTFVGEFACNTKDGKKIYIQCSLGVLLNENNETRGFLFAFNDATKEIEASRKIIENQATLNSILNSTNEALLAYDKNYVVLMVNDNAKDDIKTLLNYDITIGVQIPKNLRKHFLKKNIFTSELLALEEKIRTVNSPEGNKVIEISYAMIKDSNNTILGVLETGKDITELRKKEELLIKSESQYRFLVDNMNAGVSLIRPDGTHDFINSKGLEIFGINQNSKKLRKHFSNLFHDDEYKRFVSVRNKLTPNSRVKNELYKAINNQGDTVYLELAISLVGEPENEDAPYLFSYTDVTKAIEAKKELTNREATLNAVLNSTPNGIYAIDKNLNVIAANRQAISDFKKQINCKISIGKNLKEIIDPNLLSKWKSTYFDKVFKGKTFKYVGPSDGDAHFIENTYAPVVTEKGEIIGCLEVSKDISELKIKEVELKESEKKYRLLIETSPTGILQINLSGELVFMSNRAAEILEYKSSQCIGMDAFRFVHPDYHQHLLDILGLLFKDKKEVVETALTALTKKGKNIKVEGSSKLIKNKEGETEGILVVFSDISEKEKTRKALESSQAYFSKMYENSFDPILIYNYEKEEIIECNNATLKLLGYTSKKELKKLSRYDIIPKKTKSFPLVDQHKALDLHLNKVRKNNSINSSAVILTKSGEELITSINIIPTEQNTTEAFVLVHDITERFKSIQALEQSKKKIEYERALYEAIIKNSFDGVDITEFTREKNKYIKPRIVLRNDIMKSFLPNDNITYTNLDEIRALKPRRLRSLNLDLPVSQKDIEESYNSIIKEIFSESPKKLELVLTTKNNTHYAVESSHKIIDFYDNAYMIRNFNDITDRISQEEIINKQIVNLNEKNKELQRYIESNMQLENFAYIASHDLKAPLRSVSSFAHLLKLNCYKDLDEKGKKFLDIIEESSKNMQWLIDDLLDYSRLNTENIRLVKLNIKRLLSRILTGLEKEIKEKNAKIVLEDIPEFIFADESMMIQLFQNLIHNAIKFVKEGENPDITITAILEKEYYHFIVKDKGIGISKENTSKIFGIFTKLHSNDVYKGTGLGLTICKTIVERHKGTIWVESKLGYGTEFHFTIQFAKLK